MDTAVDELSLLLAQLDETPQNVPHLLRAIDLMSTLGLVSEQVDTMDKLSELVMLSESQWQVYFDAMPPAVDLDVVANTLERYEHAEQDYASPALLSRHIRFLRDSSQLSADSVRTMIQAVVHSSAALINESHKMWQLWLEWELEQELDVERIHEMYLDRLSTPHTAIQSTFDAYSTFCSAHAPNDYESRLVAATQASQIPKQVLSGERRFGKTRQDLEDALSVTDSKGVVFTEYIRWETDTRAKKPNPELTRGIFERAIAWAAASDKPSEADIWRNYVSWAGISAAQRAVRACPSSGALWSQLLTESESEGLDLEPIYENSIALGMAEGVDVHLHWASYLSRASADVLAAVTRGFEISGTSDGPCKLEKFLLEWAETKEPDALDQALALVETPSKARSSSHQLAILRSGIEMRRGNIHKSREILLKSIQRSDLDWPEAVYEALDRLEAVHGDLKTIKQSRRAVERESEKLAVRRQKLAAEYAQYQPEIVVPVAEPAVPDKPLERDREHTSIVVTGLTDATSARLETFFADCGTIREVTILGSSALVEFRKVEAVPLALDRDRKKLDNHEIRVSMMWRSTLWITNFAPDADDESIRAMFNPYGHILQTRWPSKKYNEDRRFCYVTMESPAAAQNALALGTGGMTVLISDPAAKAKRSDSEQTSLFVGGLTSHTTEADLREQFEKFGTIRFIKLVHDHATNLFKGIAFVHMSTEAEAKAAMALHGAHLNGKLLNVRLSDPNFKKKPVDKRATIRLHGLPDNTQEGLLQQALEKIVPVKRLEVFAKQREAVAELVHATDTGKLLLRTEPFIFNGATVAFSATGKPPAVDIPFAPRTARRKALGKSRQAPVVDKALDTGDKGQDHFRDIVAAQNSQRKGNLDARLEDSDDRPSKRAKMGSNS